VGEGLSLPMAQAISTDPPFFYRGGGSTSYDCKCRSERQSCGKAKRDPLLN
jgi:hypothetical protein